VGSVISGTLRSKDLLRTLAVELEALDTEGRYTGLVAESRSVDAGSDDVHEVLSELEDALGEFALPYCYFGAHPDDAADFGYWPDWDAIETDRRDGTLPSGDELPAGGAASPYYLHISDHGNAELYAWDSAGRRWKSVWGVV
jgi:hypothetical protein